MKLHKKNSIFSDHQEYSINNAFQKMLDGCDYCAERDIYMVETNLSNTIYALAHLIETLHATGVLSDDMVISLLNNNFEKIEDIT